MILWFSGTGNSRRVARDLARILDDEARFMMPGLKVASDRIIWVFPVHSWGVPPYVLSCIASARCPAGSRHFMVATCGDDCGNTSRMWRRAVEARGWEALGAYSVTMPNTYVCLPGFDVDSPALEQSKLSAEPQRVAEIARRIEAGAKEDDLIRGSFPWFKTTVIYPLFIPRATSDRPFRVDPTACISCGKCATACPVSNIAMKSGADPGGAPSAVQGGTTPIASLGAVQGAALPQWLGHCTGCLGCYHICPRHAISRGSTSARKGQYYLL